MVGAKSRKEPEQEIGFSSQGREEGEEGGREGGGRGREGGEGGREGGGRGREGEEGGREGGGRGREGGGRAIQCPWPDGSRTQKLPVRS
jgi:hypothetical protein